MGTFLRKNHRALKLGTLTLLDTLVNNYSSSLNIALLNTVMVELPPLISDTDFHIAQLTLVLLTSIAKLQPLALSSSGVLPEIIGLAKSPLLQGTYCGIVSAPFGYYGRFQKVVVVVAVAVDRV